MDCHFKKYLSAYQDGELGPEEQVTIMNHLKNCQSCHEYYAELQQVWSAFEKVKKISPSTGFSRRVFARIDAERHEPDFIEKLVSAIRPLPAVGSLITVLGMGLIVGIFLGNNLANPDRIRNSNQKNYAVEDPDFNAFRVFAPNPPGSLEESYLKMTKYKENNGNEG
ncbi:MAG: zf-HC2 domain-containing protein [Smithella sp.]